MVSCDEENKRDGDGMEKKKNSFNFFATCFLLFIFSCEEKKKNASFMSIMLLFTFK